MQLNIKLKELLRLHDESVQEIGLTSSLGDNYLLSKNPLFKKIRLDSKKLGYSYTTDDFCFYNVLPYASLPQILMHKKIPYFDNVTVLREIEKLHPNKFTCAELIKVKSNYALHESSHCLADFYLSALSFDSLSIPEEGKKALKLVMAESFANSVESLANVFNATAEARLFYDLNSYMSHTKKVNTALQQSIDQIGLEQTFQLMYVSYLYSNILTPEVSTKLFHQILDLVLKDKADVKIAMNSAAIRRMFNHAFELSLDFRVQTTGFFCAFSGLNTPLEKLFNFNLCNILEKHNLIQNFFKKTSPIFRM